MERVVETRCSASDEQVSVSSAPIREAHNLFPIFCNVTRQFVTVKFQKRAFVGLFPGGGTVTGKGIA